MDAHTYQKLASRTLIDAPDHTLSDLELMRTWCAMGLVGEAGEVAEIVKKAVFHRHEADPAQIANEIGDVLWYIAALCTKYDLSLSDIMQANIDKIGKRYPRGYSSQDSIKRVDLDDHTSSE